MGVVTEGRSVGMGRCERRARDNHVGCEESGTHVVVRRLDDRGVEGGSSDLFDGTAFVQIVTKSSFGGDNQRTAVQPPHLTVLFWLTVSVSAGNLQE